ncbi:MAG: alanine--tRNA ligase [Bacteroidetes bacterium]|nr:alanine--tRNA ligase [Bacteroidota bacterium]MBT4410365.1 alanine--tRNA ligase [Bacteroidota bacterium]
MTSKVIREKFQEFFIAKMHDIVSSAPMVVKNDPTLMFTNAGMNQFKDIFLGNQKPKSLRVANSQKCLRVSGKHNDLEEVGHDTYHHTMFEMLGNWSFGDYFKTDAINWAWEFLIDCMGIDPERIYATIFEGDKQDNLPSDSEAYELWLKHLDKSRILDGSKKDNFWEMGDTGPCGPCSEVHVDLRDQEERNKVSGAELVNKDHPLVIEIWNLVFIQYNRKKDKSLHPLPQKHVDTGMGFERLCMILQNKKSNYDTDVFQPLIQNISAKAKHQYGKNEEKDIAVRVIADHLRAVAFAIADGQLPSNTGAGYVIRRILRRSVRYAYTFLGFRAPFLAEILPSLNEVLGDAYPELTKQNDLITKVITEEEISFLRTLETGIGRLDQIILEHEDIDSKVVHGKQAFELFDTFGFPLDLTQLILSERGLSVNLREFNEEMAKQKNRSRSAAEQESGDWIVLLEDEKEEFIGYDHSDAQIRITRHRQIKTKKGTHYQLVFNFTPFYAESGGQVGDKGKIVHNNEVIEIIDTQKENNLIIHKVKKLPLDTSGVFTATVDSVQRMHTMRNHTGTHLLHQALREILGSHVEQKGSLVNPNYLRFDFSHYEKVSAEDLENIESRVNELIRKNLSLQELTNIPMNEASEMGAMALFGEKYGDVVRVIQYGDSIELCGGTHVKATGEIGILKITTEGSIATGIRRIEALTGLGAEEWIREHLSTMNKIVNLVKSNNDLVDSISKNLEENATLKKQMEKFKNEKVKEVKNDLYKHIEMVNEIQVIRSVVDLPDAGKIRDLAFQIRGEKENLILILGAIFNNKPNLSIMISDDLIKQFDLNAGQIIRKSAQKMKGGGGGQAFFATAGGKDKEGLQEAMDESLKLLLEQR